MSGAEKPTPQAGDVWSYEWINGDIQGTRKLGERAVDEAGESYWPWVGSSIGGGWRDGAWSDPEIKMTLVSREAAPVERAWSRWLPPAPLPDSGEKEFKVGQVWAFSRPHDTFFGPMVFRVSSAHASAHVLAGLLLGKPWVSVTGSDSGRNAVLVQDVGEPEPRDPAAVFGTGSDAPRKVAVGDVYQDRQSGKTYPVTELRRWHAICQRSDGTGYTALPLDGNGALLNPDAYTLVSTGAAAIHGGAGEPRTKTSTRVRHETATPPPPAAPLSLPLDFGVCARITRSGLPCDLPAGHSRDRDCALLPHARPVDHGVTEAELAYLASKGLVSARPDLSPYNRKPAGVSAAELAALAAGPWGRGGGR